MANLNGQEGPEKRQTLINRILDGIGGSKAGVALGQFGSGFGQAFNLDSEDRRDALYSRREAEGKAAAQSRAGRA